jgi:hypothetical protein
LNQFFGNLPNSGFLALSDRDRAARVSSVILSRSALSVAVEIAPKLKHRKD